MKNSLLHSVFLLGCLALATRFSSVAGQGQDACAVYSVNEFGWTDRTEVPLYAVGGGNREMFDDGDSIAPAGGTYEIRNSQLHVIAPPASSSYVYQEFNPHCVDTSAQTTLANGALTHVRFTLRATRGSTFSFRIAAPRAPAETTSFVQCDTGTWFRGAVLPLSQFHTPDGQTHVIDIPLSAYAEAYNLDVTYGLHSMIFEFGPNAGEFWLDNFALVGFQCNGVTASPNQTTSGGNNGNNGNPGPVNVPNPVPSTPRPTSDASRNSIAYNFLIFISFIIWMY
jgi:hypothetical protein